MFCDSLQLTEIEIRSADGPGKDSQPRFTLKIQTDQSHATQLVGMLLGRALPSEGSGSLTALAAPSVTTDPLPSLATPLLRDSSAEDVSRVTQEVSEPQEVPEPQAVSAPGTSHPSSLNPRSKLRVSDPDGEDEEVDESDEEGEYESVDEGDA